MGQLYRPERDLIKVTEQQERQRSRMEHLYLLWILRNLAWIAMTAVSAVTRMKHGRVLTAKEEEFLARFTK